MVSSACAGPISTFFTHGLIVGIFAIIGHVYPIYLKFKGGGL